MGWLTRSFLRTAKGDSLLIQYGCVQDDQTWADARGITRLMRLRRVGAAL